MKKIHKWLKLLSKKVLFKWTAIAVFRSDIQIKMSKYYNCRYSYCFGRVLMSYTVFVSSVNKKVIKNNITNCNTIENGKK